MIQKELVQEKNRLVKAIKSIEFTIDEKIKKGETDVSPLYERINKLDIELKAVNHQMDNYTNDRFSDTKENEKRAASIIAGANTEIRPTQDLKINNMRELVKEKKKNTKKRLEIKEINPDKP